VNTLPPQFELLHSNGPYPVYRDRESGRRLILKRKAPAGALVAPRRMRFRQELALYRLLGERLRGVRAVRVPEVLYVDESSLTIGLEYVDFAGASQRHALTNDVRVRQAFIQGMLAMNLALEDGDTTRLAAGHDLTHAPLATVASLSLRLAGTLGVPRLAVIARKIARASRRQVRLAPCLVHGDLKTGINWDLDRDDRFVVFDLERATATSKWLLLDAISAAYSPERPRSVDWDLLQRYLHGVPRELRDRLDLRAQLTVATILRQLSRIWMRRANPATLVRDEDPLRLDAALAWIDDPELARLLAGLAR
jgi:hypothetical protein